VIVLNATGLHWILRDYIAYYMRARTDLALDKDTRARAPGYTAVSRSHCRHCGSRRAASPYDRIAA